MRAVAVFPGTREIRLVDHQAPTLSRPADVKLRMLDVGICGTDKEIAAFEYGTPPPGADYLVLGHESLGEVVELGPAVAGLALGDLVVPMVRRPCRHATCVACVEGRQDFCYTGDFRERGIKEAHGFMTELVVEDADYLHPVPRELRDVAVLVEPLTIAEKALAQVSDIQVRLPWSCPLVPGKPARSCRRALVVGAGPVGLLGAMALAHHGFDTYVYSREPPGSPKSAIAAEIGATYISAETHPVARIPEITGTLDLVYEAVGASRLAFQVLGLLGPNAAFVFTGVPGRRGPVEVDTDLLMRNLVLKNQVLFGTVNAGRPAFTAAIEDLTAFLKKWPGAVRALITARHPLAAAVDLLAGGDSGGIKNVISVGED